MITLLCMYDDLLCMYNDLLRMYVLLFEFLLNICKCCDNTFCGKC